MSTWGGELTDLEQRASIDSLEDLHVRRRQLLPEYATLRALHGPGNKWDARRKTMLSAIAIRVRMNPPAGIKITDDTVDALAHGDDQYVTFVDEGIASHTRYIVLETEMNELEERIRNREFCLTAYGREISLR